MKDDYKINKEYINIDKSIYKNDIYSLYKINTKTKEQANKLYNYVYRTTNEFTWEDIVKLPELLDAINKTLLKKIIQNVSQKDLANFIINNPQYKKLN